VDAGQTRRVLGWEPQLSFDAGILAMAQWYLQEKRS
jgi:nucleoside-diphosphate-sugar epimerase